MNKKTGLARFLLALSMGPLWSVVTPFGVSASELAESCNHCHGDNGISTEPKVPIIAGMSELFISDTIAIYKDRDRPCVESEYLAGPDKGSKTDMCRIADKLGDEDIKAVAKHYAGLSFVRVKQEFDAGKAAQGEKVHNSSCKKCHEEGGSVAEDDAGFLGGQWTPYLRQVFEHYAAGERAMPKKMKPKFEELSAEDVDALLNYYASVQ